MNAIAFLERAGKESNKRDNASETVVADRQPSTLDVNVLGIKDQSSKLAIIRTLGDDLGLAL